MQAGIESELLQNQVMTIETRETSKDKLTIRTELEKEFDAGINMDKCIKLLSLTDNELMQETLLKNETEENTIHEYSSTEEEPETPKVNYREPQIPGREVLMDQGGPSNWQVVPHQGDAEMYDVHLPILIDLDLYEELKIIEAELTELNNETYSTEFSDPEEEYERRKAKEFSSNNNYNWWEDYSGPDTD